MKDLVMPLFQLDKTSSVPLHQQIADWITRQIESGKWLPRYKLKGEAELAKDMKVARGTLRKSMQTLIRTGRIVQVHGRGTFVASHEKQLEQPLAGRFITFSEALAEQGLSFKTKVVSQSIGYPPENIRKLLNLKSKQKVFSIQRVRYLSGEPAIHMVNHVSCEFCPGIERLDFWRIRLFDAIEKEFGLQIRSGKRTFEARSANAHLSGLLEVPTGAPLLFIEQISFLANGRAIECSEIHMKSDLIRVTTTLTR